MPIAAVLLLAALPSVTLGSHPARAVAGKTWTAPLRVQPAAAGRPVVRASAPRHAALMLSVRPAGPGRYRVQATFPAAGAWTLTATLGAPRRRLGRIPVPSAPPPALQGAASLKAPCASRQIPFPQDGLVAAGGGFWLACRERGALLHLDGAGRRTATVPLPGLR